MKVSIHCLHVVDITRGLRGFLVSLQYMGFNTVDGKINLNTINNQTYMVL